MKVSFSIPSNSKSIPKPPIPMAAVSAVYGEDEEEDDQTFTVFITEFDASKPLIKPNSKPSFVIPRLENVRPAFKKMKKNLESIPPCRYILSDPSCRCIQFKLDSSSHVRDMKFSEGLNIRNNNDENNNSINGVAAEVVAESTAPAAPVVKVHLQCLREDLGRLPEDPGFEEFEDMPIEGFGEALLAKNGWVEGRGIGRNAKEDVKLKDYPRRTNREGLGYVSKEKREQLRLQEEHNYLVPSNFLGSHLSNLISHAKVRTLSKRNYHLQHIEKEREAEQERLWLMDKKKLSVLKYELTMPGCKLSIPELEQLRHIMIFLQQSPGSFSQHLGK